jgi:hypothetical protein
MSLPPRVLRSRRSGTTSSGRANVALKVERSLEPLRGPEVLEVLRVRALGSLLLEEIVDSPRHELQMPHPASRHRTGLAKSSDRIGTKVIERI